MKSDTSHISACQRIWLDHLMTCEACARARVWSMGPACPEGQAAYGEYCAAFEANRDCESLEATCATLPMLK